MEELTGRRDYGSERRANVIRQLMKENSFSKYTRLISKEVELDNLVIDKIGFKKWNNNIDVGFNIANNKLCVEISVFNRDTCVFEVRESVVYSTKLNLNDWVLRGVWEHFMKR